MSKKASKKPAFGGLLVNEDDALNMVGGIVEKGFSEQAISRPTTFSSVHRPTVLPFPVARHRSHGPHWAPKVGDVCGSDDHDDEENEEDFTRMDKIGAFAKPVQRKETKGLDFSRWREIVASDNKSMSYKRKESDKSTSEERKAVTEASQNMNNSDTQYINGARLSVISEDGAETRDVSMEDVHMVCEQEEDMTIGIEQRDVQQRANHSVLLGQISGNEITAQEGEITTEMHHTLLKKSQLDTQVNSQNCYSSATKVGASFDSQRVEGRHNVSSLESEIDAENRAQLSRMSADEIAEAQAELMGKFSPAVLEALKRKGQEKLKRKNSYGSGSQHSGENESLQNLINNKNTCAPSANGNPQMSNTNSQGTGRNLEVDTPKLSSSTSLWDAWSKRVESVRELRFSLDGNIVESAFDVPKNGNVLSHAGYTADNVSERDFLRTEGDPGAVGYTIKEAVALARSVIPGQRALALHLIACVLDKAIHGIYQNQLDCTLRSQDGARFSDWEAIWAFTLGPEPELALSLR